MMANSRSSSEYRKMKSARSSDTSWLFLIMQSFNSCLLAVCPISYPTQGQITVDFINFEWVEFNSHQPYVSVVTVSTCDCPPTFSFSVNARCRVGITMVRSEDMLANITVGAYTVGVLSADCRKNHKQMPNMADVVHKMTT